MVRLNSAPLKGRIREVFGTQEKFAEAVGLSSTSVNNILNGKSELKFSQITVWAQSLGIPLDSAEFNRVFFSLQTCENTD